MKKYRTLFELCDAITSEEIHQLPPRHKLGLRLVRPEYSASVQEIKTYPQLAKDRIFALCWKFDKDCNLWATMYPSRQPFCCHRQADGCVKTQLHTHDYIELGYVIQGTFRQKILGKDTTFAQGDLWLVDKNCLHQDYLTEPSTVILFLGIANDMFTEIMHEDSTTPNIVSFLQAALLKQKSVQQYLHFRPHLKESGLEDCLKQILEELVEERPGAPHILKGLLIRSFFLISTRYDFALSKEQKKTRNWMIFEEISQYIQQHSSTITIQELSRVFHFQEDYFNRLIKSKTGLTYSAYVQQLRLTQAEQLLLHTDKTVEEIAAAVGYRNRGFFYKLFVKKNHMTPSAFRKASGPGI